MDRTWFGMAASRPWRIASALALVAGLLLAAGDAFGCSVAISGDTLAVGAPGRDTLGLDAAGAAYVFVRSGAGWALQAELALADGAELDQFGCSVAISGDTIVVGAPYHNHRVGAAYAFELATPPKTPAPTWRR